MVAPRRGPSRISQRQFTLIRQTSRKQQQQSKEEHRKACIMKNMKTPMMDVSVQILTGRSISLRISVNDTIQDVAEKIRMKEGINPDQQLLLYNGRRMHVDCTVSDCNILANSKLFLTVRGVGG
jgi:hypothetical protein